MKFDFAYERQPPVRSNPSARRGDGSSDATKRSRPRGSPRGRCSARSRTAEARLATQLEAEEVARSRATACENLRSDRRRGRRDRRQCARAAHGPGGRPREDQPGRADASRGEDATRPSGGTVRERWAVDIAQWKLPTLEELDRRTPRRRKTERRPKATSGAARAAEA